MRYISIHAPHEGERPSHRISPHRRWTYFNPRSPRGGATNGAYDAIAHDKFQSTLPTRGSDRTRAAPPRHHTGYFNPRSPRGGATWRSRLHRGGGGKISIHAPHEGERPLRISRHVVRIYNFNPRSPRGGATVGVAYHARQLLAFQSTLPTRGSDV